MIEKIEISKDNYIIQQPTIKSNTPTKNIKSVSFKTIEDFEKIVECPMLVIANSIDVFKYLLWNKHFIVGQDNTIYKIPRRTLAEIRKIYRDIITF